MSEKEKIELKLKQSAWQKALPSVICPHCKKTGRGTVMKRWHFDNCKFKI